VTGARRGATTSVLCIDIAALVTAALLRRNPRARVLPFSDGVVPVEVNPRDSVMTNAARLASIGGGATNCSAPLHLLNHERVRVDAVVFISDNQSWIDPRAGRGTALLREWQQLRARNPKARLVCVDVQPYETTQAADREDILNIGGFSDQVFDVISAFVSGELDPEHWIGRIEATAI
jgi:60 kDa SS-A/Ro ribonucleoprotein